LIGAQNLDPNKQKLQETQKDIDRLIKNRGILFDIMTDMVFLIREDYVIEYMNPSAKRLFGDLHGKKCFTNLHKSKKPCQSPCPVKLMQEGQLDKGLLEMQIGKTHVEATYSPYKGYRGDNLVMVVKRDVTERKKHEKEIEQYRHNIEEVLQNKISELKESEKTRKQLSKEVNILKTQLRIADQTDEMIGSSRKMRELREMIHQVASSEATVLVTGESGTGKELVVNLLRNLSDRNDKPFLKVDCNTINDSLLESDLFGYEKGSFTGANARKKGKFEIVDGGTIFLDEIGDITPKMQAALLRVLQNGEIIRVGGNESIRVNVRVLAATNVDLSKAVQEGRFRLDLYYRLNIINIILPPLRERKEDIVELAAHFVKHYRKAFKKDIDFLPNKIINRLLLHDWPGNVRELENVVQRAVLMAKHNMITDKLLVFDTNLSSESNENPTHQTYNKLTNMSLKDILLEFEGDIIIEALKKNKGNVQQTAEILKIGKTALYDKMKRYKISAKKNSQ
jgi:transcriptional regulator with PAS, ATPase and Fis domain